MAVVALVAISGCGTESQVGASTPSHSGGGGCSASSANATGQTGTAVITEYPIPTAQSDAHHFTSGPDGNLWFTEESGANKIGKVTTSGAFTEYLIRVFETDDRGRVSLLVP